MAEVGKNPASEEPLGGFAALVVFLASFALYALTSSPAMGWLDSPEFVAQATTLGVAHSPGHPLPALLGRLATLVPMGDLVWRVNLVSSSCAAGAVALLFTTLRRLVVEKAPRMPLPSVNWIAASLALVAAASWAVWSNAVRAEVYALQSLLSVGALYGLLRYESSRRERWLLLAAFLLALGLANHHLLALTILGPGFLFVLLPAWRPTRATILRSASIGMLGLCALLYLPIRSLTHPLVNFGAPHTVERFLWTLRGAAFSKSANLEHASNPVLDAAQTSIALAEALTLPLFLFAIYGVWAGRASTAVRRYSGFLLAITALCVGIRVLLGFDPETPDHHAYLLPAILSLFLLAGMGIAHLVEMATSAERPLRRAPALTAFALAILVPVQIAGNMEASSQRSAWASDDMAHWEHEDLPPRALVLVAYFQTTFRTWALQSVEGHRPDIVYLDRSFLSYPGMREESIRRHPEYEPLLSTPLQAGLPTPVSLLQRIHPANSVHVQLHPNVDMELARALHPQGPWASFEDDHDRDRRFRARLEEIVDSAAPSEEYEARAALLWHDATRLDELCITGDRPRAMEVYRDAILLAPDDIMLGEMAVRCRLVPPSAIPQP